jgi:hypothetical protein
VCRSEVWLSVGGGWPGCQWFTGSVLRCAGSGCGSFAFSTAGADIGKDPGVQGVGEVVLGHDQESQECKDCRDGAGGNLDPKDGLGGLGCP